MSRRRKTSLPRLAILAYSAAELQRFSDAAELTARVSHDLGQLVTDLECGVRAVQQLAERLQAMAEELMASRVKRRQRRSSSDAPNEGIVPTGA